MDKPYQRDIELLRKELECYKYVADNCKKEHSEQFQRYLTTTCLELRYAIETMEERQKTAVKELEVLSLRERERMLEPLFQAAEELSGYIQQFITGFLMDLVDYRYQPG